VDDLAAALDVSRPTIKRDLAALRGAGHAVQTRGSQSG
jgi:DeoR/GlpR family transcriptional regulator of sugar metabolism